jgi:hypothetical protein
MTTRRRIPKAHIRLAEKLRDEGWPCAIIAKRLRWKRSRLDYVLYGRCPKARRKAALKVAGETPEKVVVPDWPLPKVERIVCEEVAKYFCEPCNAWVYLSPCPACIAREGLKDKGKFTASMREC